MHESRAIEPVYRDPTATEIQALLQEGAAGEIEEKHGIVLGRCYFSEGMEGTHRRMFAREAVVHRMYRISEQLGDGYGLYIFDSFRSRIAQRALFEKVYRQVRSAHAEWSDQECFEHTKTYVAYADDPFLVTPHNSGGAIDLTIHYQGTPVEMGGAFDEPTERSRTVFYEREFDARAGLTRAQWDEARYHRRRLFNGMVDEGFVNYDEEWWHYDLGDRIWGALLQREPIFLSMEADVEKWLAQNP